MLVEMNEHDQDCLAVGVRQSLCPLQDVPHTLHRDAHSEAGEEIRKKENNLYRKLTCNILVRVAILNLSQ